MMIFIEKIEPPPRVVPLTDDEQLKAISEAIASEDLWVKNFIDRLAGVVCLAGLAPMTDEFDWLDGMVAPGGLMASWLTSGRPGRVLAREAY